MSDNSTPGDAQFERVQVPNPIGKLSYISKNFKGELIQKFEIDTTWLPPRHGKLMPRISNFNLMRELELKHIADFSRWADNIELLVREPNITNALKYLWRETSDDQFLRSWKWTTLRYKVLLKYGRRCMCCGANPDDGETVIHVDHIKPRHEHPKLALDASNLQVLCAACNRGKGAWDQTDHRKPNNKTTSRLEDETN